MPTTRILIYQEASGQAPLVRWLDGLSGKAQEVSKAKVELLQEYGHNLRMPHAKFLQEGIFELRARQQRLRLRILYCFVGKNIALVSHGFVKKTRRTPKREIERAIQNRKCYLIDPVRHTKEISDEE